MSAENLELVRRWYAAMSAGRDGAIPAVEELWDAEADHHPVRKFPDAGPSRTRQEFVAWLERYFEAFPRNTWTLSELIGVGDDRVLACGTLKVEGGGSGLSFGGDIYQCFRLRGGRIVHADDHMTLKGALRSLGLEGDTLEEAGLEKRPPAP